MPRLQSLVPRLRPLAAPRPATCPHFRFSTATRLRVEQPLPRPIPNAPQAAQRLVAESDSAQSPSKRLKSAATPPELFSKAKTLKNISREKKASTSETTIFRPATHIELPPPSYHISRTATKNLPIYTDYKRGGNLHLTTIRKITGDLSALRDELRVFLNKKNEDVRINALTGHVVVKGHCTGQVKEFLEARGM